MSKLTEHQQQVINAFHVPDTDIDIVVLYTRIYGDPGTLTARECQQKLSQMFSHVNEKITDGKIEVGELKRTYRLTSIKG